MSDAAAAPLRGRRGRWLGSRTGIGVGAVMLTALVGAVMLRLGGFDPWDALAAMVRGSFGSPQVFVSITLVRSVPLILTGLAVAWAFRAGVWNIGAEGQLYAGAVAAVWVGLTFTALPGWILVPATLSAGLLAGSAWTVVPALMRIRLGVGEVITTILMNFVALYLAAWMVHGPLQEEGGVFPQTEAVVAAARLPTLPGTRLHLGFALAVVLAVVLALVLSRSTFGFRLTAVGASPDAARVSGRIAASRVVVTSFLLSGALAGLAGGVEIAGVTFALYEDLSPGWGYTAIAVALLAGLHPVGVVFTGLLFGALQAGAGAMQREAGIPAAWVNVVEALVILAVLGVERVRSAVFRDGGGP